MNIKHGHNRSKTDGISPTYISWQGMRGRCLNPNFSKYPEYGGRGITIEERWNSFENFLEDMGERPEGYTLNRRDNNGPYCKENCKWATIAEQNVNQRTRKDNLLGEKNIRELKGRYQIRIHRNKRTIYLGCYELLEDAIVARDCYLRGEANG